ncbi:MAG TPA: carboxypeptidase-like regulatory domain-containing protein, partial [Rhodothermales bacterium]
MRSRVTVVTVVLIVCATLTFEWAASAPLPAATGKIAGTVTDASSGDPLPGANVIIEGTSFGASTDVLGQFTILDLAPGVYSVQVSMVGFATLTVTDVRVSINQTTALDVQLT